MARLTPSSHWKLNDNAASTAVVDAMATADGVYTDNAAGVNTSTSAQLECSAIALRSSVLPDLTGLAR